MKIYTKKGDDGNTAIIKGRISKASDTIELIGTLDEFNAFLGLLREALSYDSFSNLSSLYDSFIKEIQSNIFTIGTLIVGGNLNKNFVKETKKLEKSIDDISKQLQPLQNFILPGGNILSTKAHICRAICRKAERRFVSYTYKINDMNSILLTDILKEKTPDIRSYLNRLSDWLFVFARIANLQTNTPDEIWQS
jgi:cob(I)alamin adenosyltransferase